MDEGGAYVVGARYDVVCAIVAEDVAGPLGAAVVGVGARVGAPPSAFEGARVAALADDGAGPPGAAGECAQS